MGLSPAPPSLNTIQSADVLMAVGCTFGQFTTRNFGHEIVPQEAKIIQIDIDPTEIGKIYPVEVGIVGDACRVLDDLLQEVKRRGIDRRPVSTVTSDQRFDTGKEQVARVSPFPRGVGQGSHPLVPSPSRLAPGTSSKCNSGCGIRWYRRLV